MRFPYSPIISIKLGHLGTVDVSSRQIVELLGPYLTPERMGRIDAVISTRTCNVVPVLENIYDRGNVSAVMRSAESLGFQCVHNIETGTKFKAANRVTAGADKWLKTYRWENSLNCVQFLRENGYRILVTHLQDAKPIDTFDFSIPTAIAYGNEKDGISDELLALSDGAVKIPMQGFTQSFNISVAAALSLYHITQDRKSRLGQHGDLSAEEKLSLQAEYIWNTMGNPEAILERLIAEESFSAKL